MFYLSKFVRRRHHLLQIAVVKIQLVHQHYIPTTNNKKLAEQLLFFTWLHDQTKSQKKIPRIFSCIFPMAEGLPFWDKAPGRRCGDDGRCQGAPHEDWGGKHFAVPAESFYFLFLGTQSGWSNFGIKWPWNNCWLKLWNWILWYFSLFLLSLKRHFWSFGSCFFFFFLNSLEGSM